MTVRKAFGPERIGLALVLATNVSMACAQQVDVGGIIGTLMQGAIQAEQLQRSNQQRQHQRDRDFGARGQDDYPAPSYGNPLHPDRRQAPPPVAFAQSSGPFTLDGLVLGTTVGRNALSDEYTCKPSDDFPGFTWCRRSRREGAGLVATAMLTSRDARLAYANKVVSPALFGPNEITQEINRLTVKFHVAPHVLTMPSRAGLPNAVIVTWGAISLDPVGPEAARLLANGTSTETGILLDFLGDYRMSAQQGEPIYRIGGGAGFLWAASYDRTGRGNLRFGAADASMFQPRPALTSDAMANAAPFDPSQVAGGSGSPPGTTDGPAQPAGGGFIGLAGSAAAAPLAAAPSITVPAPASTSLFAAGQAAPGQASASPSSGGPSTRTVVVEGLGTDLESAAKNAAENALTQVVGSFIDSNTMLTKHAVIADGIKKETKDVSSTVREYSQGAIQDIALGQPTLEAGLMRVTATITVRIEDFKAYIQKTAIGEAPMGAGLFAQMASAQDNQKSLEAILYDKIVHPILYGETVRVAVRTPVPFNQSGLPSNLIGQWNPAATVVIPVELALDRNFLANLGQTLDSVASGRAQLPYAENRTDCETALGTFDRASDVGLSFMSDQRMFSAGQKSFYGKPMSTYKLSGIRNQHLDDETKLDIQILDASGTTLFEAIRSENFRDPRATALIESTSSGTPPWRLVKQNGQCIEIATDSNFYVAMQLDENTLRNAAKVSITIRK